ncbi:gfo/Idh/MocA family oxidoreductase [Micromonospora sp. BL4]|uniref:Gfo/Idh/MocA family protein n=1 Tax=Micromonospora sp. BL4 TaxID=2478710 RepID=UPI000EF5D9B2|nr:Gfo/Idh/MocA family oxidoreductase [Micromonospora sp. BL4]RLP93562.1 gfo/Idh/MocA family oxidoreductase [Micromonospora sp. BL4]
MGIIGLGEVAQVVHLPVLRSLPDLYEVTAVCDISPGLLERVGGGYGVARRYADHIEMLDENGLDCVLVLNSDEYHAEAVIAALDRGIHVLVEKPMCLSPREAQAIIEARDRSGATVMVGYMRRFAPAFIEASQQIGALGRLNYARVHDIIGRNQLMIDQTVFVDRPSDVPRSAVEARWAKGRALVTDALGDVPDVLAGAYRLLCGLGSHDLSAMRELLGRPRGVVAARQWRDGRFITALLEYDDFLVTYETGVDEQLRFDAHIEVYGEHATMRLQYDTPYIRHLPTTLVTEETRGDSLHRIVSRPHLKDPYTHELEYFHEMVTQGRRPKTDPEDFLEDLDLFAELIRVLATNADVRT